MPEVKNPHTIGVSPKAIAAVITSYVAVYAVAYLAKAVGLEIEVELVAALVGPPILAGVVAAATALAKVGLVRIDGDVGSEPEGLAGEQGYTLVEVGLFILVVLVGIGVLVYLT